MTYGGAWLFCTVRWWLLGRRLLKNVAASLCSLLSVADDFFLCGGKKT